MTTLMYLDGTYKFAATAEIEDTERDERGAFIVMNQTIFYPQGGGQPADRGYIHVNGDSIPVNFVSYANGIVRHNVPDAYLKKEYIGKKAKLEVDSRARIENARLHTAGHLISHVFETIDSSLIPIKGYHFPNGAYVEFINTSGLEGAQLSDAANDKLARDIISDLPVAAALSDFETISELRPNLAPYVPKDKPSRIVTIGTYLPLPCGGTHVATLAELGSVRVIKIKNQKGNMKVKYELTDAGTNSLG
jgi:Ser-tRNA(Ala) deacylase AlaX